MSSHDTALQYVPLPHEIAESARMTLQDAFGHSLAIKNTTGPCRVCLKIATSPEYLILLSHQPLADRNPYAEIGPIFIHAHDCAPYAELNRFPEDFLSLELVIRAYDTEGNIHAATVAAPGQGESAARLFFDDRAVAEVHVRHTTYTCFDFKIVRNPMADPMVLG